MLAVPIPIISRLPSTSWPCRAAKEVATEMVSARATSDAESADDQQGEVLDGHQWQDELR
jgi:hypothetical protein